jgi:gliding motility-associated-like protein
MCSDTLTKSVHVKDCPPDSIHITVPNIFSPNADGINDSWQLVISSYQYTVSNYQCTVYDRWGIKVFETSTLSQAWDGRSTGGLACSAGAYFYIIKLTATNSKGVIEQKDFKGYLELVR